MVKNICLIAIGVVGIIIMLFSGWLAFKFFCGAYAILWDNNAVVVTVDNRVPLKDFHFVIGNTELTVNALTPVHRDLFGTCNTSFVLYPEGKSKLEVTCTDEQGVRHGGTIADNLDPASIHYINVDLGPHYEMHANMRRSLFF